MDGNQGPGVVSSVAGRADDDLQELLAFCARTLQDVRQAKDRAGFIAQYRRLDELTSAIDTLLTRLEIDVVLGSVPGVASGPGSSPMFSEAMQKLRTAINVVARGDT